MQILGAVPKSDALTNDEIIASYGGELKRMIDSCKEPIYDSERQLRVNSARLQWMMVRGDHFGVPEYVDGPYGEILDYQIGNGNGNDGNEEDGIGLCPPINLIGGDCYKFRAVMGQQSPRVMAFADDVKDPDLMEAARCVNVNLRDIWKKQRVDIKWDELSFHVYTTGPAFVRTVWNTDRATYGATTEPKFDIKDGQLVQIGEQTYANGDVEVEIYSILEVSTPWKAKDLKETCPWLRLERMLSKWLLIDKFKGKDGNPGPLDKYRDNDVPDEGFSAATTSALEAIDATSRPSGTSTVQQKSEWRFSEYWFTPACYQAIMNDQARELFQDRFPDGLYIARVGDITVQIDNENKTDVWAVCRVGRDIYINENALCSNAVPLNRTMNDLWGLTIETVLRAVTRTLIDSRLVNRLAMQKKGAIPVEMIPVALTGADDLNKAVFQLDPARLSDQIPAVMKLLREFWVDIMGIKPEVAGGGQPTATFSEYRQRRNSALAQLAPQAKQMIECAGLVGANAVKLRAKYGSGLVKAQKRGSHGIETEVADMANLKMDGWYTEADDQFPMTVMDQRDSMFSILKEFPPEVQQMLSVLDPLNIEKVVELLQIPGFDSIMQEQSEKTLADVDMLVEQEPIPGPDGKLQTSIPPDPFEKHVVACAVLASWLTSKTGRDAKNQHPQGYQNVVLRWQAQQNLAAPPPPPPPPPVHGSLAISAKAEDMPWILKDVLPAAGIAVQPGDIPTAPVTPEPGIAAPAPAGEPPPMPPNGPPMPPTGPVGMGAVQ